MATPSPGTSSPLASARAAHAQQQVTLTAPQRGLARSQEGGLGRHANAPRNAAPADRADLQVLARFSTGCSRLVQGGLPRQVRCPWCYWWEGVGVGSKGSRGPCLQVKHRNMIQPFLQHANSKNGFENVGRADQQPQVAFQGPHATASRTRPASSSLSAVSRAPADGSLSWMPSSPPPRFPSPLVWFRGTTSQRIARQQPFPSRTPAFLNLAQT